MRVHFLSSGPADQTSGGFLYNRFILEHIEQIGHDVRYHGSPAGLHRVVSRDIIVVDGIVLPELADSLVSLPCPIVLLLHLAPGMSVRPPFTIAAASDALESLYARSRIVVTGSDTLSQLQKSVSRAELDAVCIEPGVPVNWQEKQQYAPVANRLLCIANYIDGKGHYAMFRCLDKLREINWRLELYGNTQLEAGYYERLLNYISQFQWADRVFFNQEIEHADVNRRMLESDLLLNFSNYESYSMVVAESIAAGLPVLARKTGNHARFGTSGIVRFIDDPDSPHASLTLRALLEGPSVYAGMRRKSAWRIRNWRDVGHEWAKLIEEHSWT
jgi:glycosyltransferase involved in cell wall biosynthesis